MAHRFLWGPAVDQLLADEQLDNGTSGVGNVLWALADHLGTIRDIADRDDGTNLFQVVNHRVYDSFGNLISQTSGSASIDFGFTGKYRDPDTGLSYHWNRWFDPALGKWLMPDPIGFAAGDANLYRYVGNASTLATDPTGWIVETGGGNGSSGSSSIDEGVMAVGLAVPKNARPNRRPMTVAQPSTDGGGNNGERVSGVLVLLYTGRLSVTRDHYESVFNQSEEKLVELHDRARNQLEALESVYPNPVSSGLLATDHAFVHDESIGGALIGVAADELIGRAIPGGKNRGGGQRIGVNVPGNGGNLPVKPGAPNPILGALAGGGKKKAKLGSTRHIKLEPANNGGYKITFESGKGYAGKGGTKRARKSARRLSRKHNDPVKTIDHFAVDNDADAFDIEATFLEELGGPKSSKNYNKYNSPGTPF